MSIYTSLWNRKGRFLKESIYKFLEQDDEVNWTERLYRHPIINNLSHKTTRLTSWIPDEAFVNALCDVLREHGSDYSIVQDKETGRMKLKEESEARFMVELSRGIDSMKESDLKRTLQFFRSRSAMREEEFTQLLKNWFNDNMGRASYTYKRLSRKPLWWLGVIVAIFFQY